MVMKGNKPVAQRRSLFFYLEVGVAESSLRFHGLKKKDGVILKNSGRKHLSEKMKKLN